MKSSAVPPLIGTDEAVDLASRQPGIHDRGLGRLKLQVELGLRRGAPTTVGRVTDADDAGFVTWRSQSPVTLSVDFNRPDYATGYQRLIPRVGQAEPLSEHASAVDSQSGSGAAHGAGKVRQPRHHPGDTDRTQILVSDLDNALAGRERGTGRTSLRA